jgi:hypothetical protein
VALKGSRELRARLKALGQVFKPLGRDWADTTVRLMRPMVPVQTGRLRRTIRRRNASAKRATVVAHYTAYFVDKGPRAHAIRPKRARMLRFQAEGRTVFAKAVHHRGYRGRPFRARAAREGLRRNPPAQALIEAWNEAA